MIGLLYLIFFAVYLGLSVWLTKRAVKAAKARGIAGWKYGLPMALVMYHLVFWDWIPTVVTHQYYCATESGFWVYKSLEQWKAENPGVMEGLASYNKNPGGFNVDWPSRHEQDVDGHLVRNINHINERFNVSVTQQDASAVLPIVRKENVLLDVKNSEVIARYVDFGTGNSVKNTIGPPGPLKLWMHNGSCIGGKEKHTKFGNFYIQFKGAEK